MQNKKMKAITFYRHGSPKVLNLEEINIPLPKENEILVKNYGSSMNTVDIVFRGGVPRIFNPVFRGLIKMFMRLRKPEYNIAGKCFAGEVVEIGEKVTKWKVGDHVFGYSENGGACAEYLAVESPMANKKPSNLSFQEAASVPGGASPAIVALRDLASPKVGQKVLIIAASGGIGTFAVQIAKNVYGAEVTGVCGPTNLDMVRKIGADHVIDYTKVNYTERDEQYDIIFDAIGASAFAKCERILTEKGIFVTVNPISRLGNMFKMKNPRFKTVEIQSESKTTEWIIEHIEAGKIKPVIDTVYPLDQTAEAHRHYETSHSRGRVVISIP